MIVFKYQGANCNNSTTLGGVYVDNPKKKDKKLRNLKLEDGTPKAKAKVQAQKPQKSSQLEGITSDRPFYNICFKDIAHVLKYQQNSHQVNI